jgi:hypothetical protein
MIPRSNLYLNTVVFPKDGQVKRHVFLGTFRTKNIFFLYSAAQNIENVFDHEFYLAILIWPSFGNTTV